MPKILEHREMALRRIVRDALAFDPLITMVSLERVVEKKINRPIDNAYLLKLVKKVQREVLSEVRRDTAENKIATIRESYRTLIEGLRRIAYDDNTPSNEKRKCFDSIAKIQDMQAKLEMDLNMFTRQIGTVNVDHRLKPVDEKTLQNVIQTFKVWSTPPQMRRIEPVRIVEAKTKESANEPTIPVPQPVSPARTPQIIPTATGTGVVVSQ